MTRRRSSRSSQQNTLPIVASLIVFSAIFLTVYVLMKSNTDVRSLADNGDRGIGQAVREEVSPGIRVASPTINSVTTNPVIITADIPSGTDVERVQFWVDNEKEAANVVFETPYEASVSLSPGRHRVAVSVYDHSGNVRQSANVPFQVQ